jgi:hypothetical protein
MFLKKASRIVQRFSTGVPLHRSTGVSWEFKARTQKEREETEE